MHLIICEKQNAAQRITTILSKGKATRTFVNRIPLYTFVDNNKKVNVIGLKGHVVNLDFPSKYNRWNHIDLKNLIQTEPIKKVQNWNIVNLLKKLAEDVDEVVIATDYDREGELIGVEGLELIQKTNSKLKVKRARFSALTAPEVKNAFNNLTEIDYNLSAAAFSRQIIDLKWGAVLTRFLSLASKQTGKDYLSVGRVQSPTLALIVDREKEISDFKSKPYWEIIAQLEKVLHFTAKHKEDRFWDKEAAQRSFTRASETSVGTVAEGRWYGALFLTQIAERIPAMAEALWAAASRCAAEHDLMCEIWNCVGGIGYSDEHVKKLGEPAVRRQITPLILQARDRDAEAAGHIERALAK